MTISELIERLEALKAEHGDAIVKAYEPSETEPNGWVDVYYEPEDGGYVVIW